MTWLTEVQSKAQLLHNQLADVRALASRSGASAEQLHAITAPYYTLLEDLYQTEYPFAKALDTSDLVVRFQGPAVESDAPELAVVAQALTGLRTQVQRIARAIFGLAASDPHTLPRGVDLRLSGLARGSLVVGVRVSEHRDVARGESVSVFGDEDPVFQTVRQAVRQLAHVTQFVSEEGVDESISEAFPDPGVRDALLVAASSLTPTGKRGIDSISLYSGASETVKATRPLTPKTRKAIQATLAKPVKSSEVGTYEGIVREIDLDAHRFEIRHVAGVGSIRCAYPSDLDRAANDWLDKRVSVSGTFERGPNGLPRLMQLQTITVLGDASASQLALGLGPSLNLPGE